MAALMADTKANDGDDARRVNEPPQEGLTKPNMAKRIVMDVIRLGEDLPLDGT
jgi:hypothetical protein